MNHTASANAEREQQRVQTVVFVRHGVARHNVLGADGRRPNLEDPALWDPPLLLEGKLGAVQVGQAIQTWWRTTQAGEQIDLIVTSPLTRCIQTATLAFLPGDRYNDAAGGDPASAQLVCKEDVREAFGKHYPDKRREKSVLQAHWPLVQFEEEMTEHDDAWSPTWRECWDDIRIRLDRFLAWLVRQPHTNIVVVSHGVSIEFLFRTYMPELLGERRVYNTDAFACHCVSSQGYFVRLQNGQQIHGHAPDR